MRCETKNQKLSGSLYNKKKLKSYLAIRLSSACSRKMVARLVCPRMIRRFCLNKLQILLEKLHDL
jgi:hypothetical protein